MIMPGTPLPWEYVDRAKADHPAIEVRGDDEETVCFKYAPKGFEAQDFAYIVHACNLYPELVEFIRGVSTFDGRHHVGRLKEMAKELLAKAGAA